MTMDDETLRISHAHFAYAASLGIASFLIAYFSESFLGTFLAPFHFFASAVIIEEILRLAICVFFQNASRSRKRAEILLWGAVASVFFGISENILYFLMSPDTTVFARILYSQPVHVVCSLCYILALRSRASVVATLAAFALALAYHGSFNAASTLLSPSTAVPAGIVVNIISLISLGTMVRDRILFKGAFNGQR